MHVDEGLTVDENRHRTINSKHGEPTVMNVQQSTKINLIEPTTNFIQALKWRYAPKKLNGKLIPAATLGRIIDAAHLAPSSYGLQPYQIFVIQDKALLQRIYQEACPQSQVDTCSDLIVFASKNDIDHKLVDEYIQGLSSGTKQPLESLHGFSQAIKQAIDSKQTHIIKSEWANRQAYISLGFAMAAAAMEKVDAAPMEGFDNLKLNQILDLQKKGLSSVALLALGYREADDKYALQPKWRRPQNEFVEWR